MKAKTTKLIAFVLVTILTVGMFTMPVGAYSTADFTDVAPSHWAYDNIMAMADEGIIKGVGGGAFAPESSLRVGEFLALIGRAMYPNDCAETAVWWETYLNAATSKGIVQSGEFETNDMERSITRNEMARILVRTDEKVNGNNAIAASTRAITDFASIPDAFKISASQAYAKGLLTGDTEGNFNGALNLKRSEASTVLKRLMDAADKPSEPEKGATGIPMTGEMITVKFGGYVECTDFYGDSGHTYPAGVNMTMTTADGRVLGTTTTYDEEIIPKRGRFTYTMTVTMDKADYAVFQDIYYMACTYVAPDGARFSNISSHTGIGKAFQLPDSRIYVVGEYDFTGSTIKFLIGNIPGSYLDF